MRFYGAVQVPVVKKKIDLTHCAYGLSDLFSLFKPLAPGGLHMIVTSRRANHQCTKGLWSKTGWGADQGEAWKPSALRWLKLTPRWWSLETDFRSLLGPENGLILWISQDGGKPVIGVCVPLGQELRLKLCAEVELQEALNPLEKENVDVYILAVTPSWPLHSSIPAIAVT